MRRRGGRKRLFSVSADLNPAASERQGKGVYWPDSGSLSDFRQFLNSVKELIRGKRRGRKGGDRFNSGVDTCLEVLWRRGGKRAKVRMQRFCVNPENKIGGKSS